MVVGERLRIDLLDEGAVRLQPALPHAPLRAADPFHQPRGKFYPLFPVEHLVLDRGTAAVDDPDLRSFSGCGGIFAIAMVSHGSPLSRRNMPLPDRFPQPGLNNSLPSVHRFSFLLERPDPLGVIMAVVDLAPKPADPLEQDRRHRYAGF